MTARPAAAETARFVQQWLASRSADGGVANPAMEVERLAAQLTADARACGITGGDIHRAVGDIDDYLAAHLHPGAV